MKVKGKVRNKVAICRISSRLQLSTLFSLPFCPRKLHQCTTFLSSQFPMAAFESLFWMHRKAWSNLHSFSHSCPR